MSATGCAGVPWEKADGWEQELERRMCLATDGDTLRGMFFNGTLEALGALGDEALVRRCLAETGEERFLDFFHYPVTMHGRLVSVVMPVLVEEYGGGEEALRQLGRLVARRFLQVGVGKVMRAMLPLSPWQLQSTLPIAYRAAVSFGEYSVRWMGPRRGIFSLRRDFMPYPFHEGVLEVALQLWGGRAVEVRGWQTGGLDSECDFRWQ